MPTDLAASIVVGVTVAAVAGLAWALDPSEASWVFRLSSILAIASAALALTVKLAEAGPDLADDAAP